MHYVRLNLPRLRVAPPARGLYYNRLSSLPLPDAGQWVPTKPSREWSLADKDKLRRGLQGLHQNQDYLRLSDPFYAISQHIMDGLFSPNEIAKAVRLINIKHPDWVCCFMSLS